MTCIVRIIQLPSAILHVVHVMLQQKYPHMIVRILPEKNLIRLTTISIEHPYIWTTLVESQDQ